MHITGPLSTPSRTESFHPLSSPSLPTLCYTSFPSVAPSTFTLQDTEHTPDTCTIQFSMRIKVSGGGHGNVLFCR